MDRRSVLALAIIFIIILLMKPYTNWLYPPQEEPAMPDTSIIESEKQAPAERPQQQRVQTAEQPQAPADTSLGSINLSNLSGEHILIETPLYQGVISTKGGTIKEWILKEYQTRAGEPVNIIRNNDAGNLGISFLTTEGEEVLNKTLDYIPQFLEKIGDAYTITVTDRNVSLHLTADLGKDRLIHKKYTFDPLSYEVMMDIEFENCHSIIANQEYDITWGTGIRTSETNIEEDMQRSKSMALYGDEVIKFDVGNSTKLITDKPQSGTIHWFATRSKYFCSLIVLLGEESEKNGRIKFSGQSVPEETLMGRKNYITTLTMNYKPVRDFSSSFLVYMGPVNYFAFKDISQKVEHDLKLSDLVLDTHYLIQPLSLLIYRVFNFLHNYISNYGFVIILFSILVNMLMYPLTAKSYKSMKKMQELQPLLNELKEKYKDDSKRLQQAQMKMYKELKINPLGGCLPIFFQMPIFFAIYPIFRAIDLRGAAFIWWIKDLSRPDTVATLPFSIPIYGDSLNILMIIYAISMFVQQKIMMKDPKQKMLVYLMPIMMLLMLNRWSSGFILYFIIFNLVTIVLRYSVRDGKSAKTAPVVEKTRKKITQKKSPKKRKK